MTRRQKGRLLLSTSTPTHTPSPHRGAGGPDVAGELRRLMPRDRWLLDLLAEHKVLTTGQVAALAFGNVHTARNRLVLLAQRGVLTRFRDGVRPGSQQWRWTLGPLGAAWAAARDGQPEPTPATIRRQANRLAASPVLAHLLAVNGFFTDLAASARDTPSARLSDWWSEHRCHSVTGDLVRPDGHGTWTEHGHACSFWLEYDRATEPPGRVAAKLDRYAALARATSTSHTVLFVLATPAREATLLARIGAHPAVTSGALTIATTGQPDQHPAGPIWALPGTPGRLRLAHIPASPSQRHAA